MLAAPMVQEILALLRSERLQIAAKQNRSELIDWPENFYSATPVNAVDMVIGHRGVIRFVISHGQPEHQQHWPEKPASVAASFPDAPRSIGRQKTVDLRVVVRLLRLTGERLSEFGRRRHFPLRFLSRHKWRPLPLDAYFELATTGTLPIQTLITFSQEDPLQWLHNQLIN